MPRMPLETHEGRLGGHSEDTEPQCVVQIRTKQALHFEKPAESHFHPAAWKIFPKQSLGLKRAEERRHLENGSLP